ncbi:hypothetical protein [Parachitinimonas caeni]|uniref:Lipoprotein n=1 Tax=Parachitinimonas caeni TaxID=3031301 RepID=A0ABT7E2I9_9NEIS|nr:hypothetical protein [Parachitinimonas caeni]MDK2126532.1 hypothetical protein [Parachitinimonas caeni]
MKILTSTPAKASALLAIALLQGCSSVAKFDSVTPGTTLAIRGMESNTLPRTEKLESKSTGQHEFVATAPSGQKLYGLLPLRVNGGTMTTSILFFAPALFIGGFRDAYAFYQVDPEAGTLSYKNREKDSWHTYKPSAAESERAKQYFDASKGSQVKMESATANKTDTAARSSN